MKIHLAGFNIDIEVLKALEAHAGERMDATPETLSAAYARISRSPKPVDELREEARLEVEKARRSNRSIIFGMGHHSVAEHAVFNFDITGVSRLAIEEIEKFRLSSYTEKSQRYITLGDDFMVPEEITRSGPGTDFVATVQRQNRLYHELYERLRTYTFVKYADLAKEKRNHSTLEGWAKEDARYVTCLATEGQLGATINARNLELLFRRFASHGLSEIQHIGREMYHLVEKVAPSIILFTRANDYDRLTYPALKDLAQQMIHTVRPSNKALSHDVTLVYYTPDADDRTIASLLHTSAAGPFLECMGMAREMNDDQKRELIKTALQHMEFYDPALREFEHVDLTFDLVVSASCFAQLKRHRMTTLTCQPYDPDLGVTIPESICEIGMEHGLREIIDQTEETFRRLKKETPQAAPYVLTNAHRKRVLLKTNARELYHISRLRQDASAQWDIRRLAGLMVEQARKVMPLTLFLAGGKDVYPGIYRDVYGHPPQVIQADLPA